MPIIIHDYDPTWPDTFAMLRDRVAPALADILVAIEHVGSTSVPGLAAKPIIDMDVVVPDSAIPDAIARLEALGYRHRGDLGIPGREAFERPPDTPAHNLYLCPPDNTALANHRAVRDHLRANPTEAHAYGELKKRLAREHADDMEGYVEAKSGFLLDVLRRSGFSADDLTAIERINRKPQNG